MELKMPTSLDQNIIEAHEAIIRKEKIVIHIDNLDQCIIEEEARLKVLEKILDKEEGEYLQFDKIGVRNLFLKALGTHKNQLDKEKQEYLISYLKYNDCVKAIERLYQEKELLMKTLFELFDAEKKLDQLFVEKRKRLASKTDQQSIQLFKLEKGLLVHLSKVKEIKEAIAAGKQTEPLLGKIIENLKHIKSWGVFEYAGKGRYSSYKKKKYIDQATKEVFEVNALLEKFEQELHDVSEHYQLDYRKDIYFFKQFVNVFLANLVNDWVIKKKINDSILGVSKTLEQVSTTFSSLQNEIKTCHELIKKDQKVIKDLLLLMAQNANKPL